MALPAKVFLTFEIESIKLSSYLGEAPAAEKLSDSTRSQFDVRRNPFGVELAQRRKGREMPQK